jgi:hypothetical protein
MKLKTVLPFILFTISLELFSQGGAHPGFDNGLSVPVDGGLLMALLAGSGLVAMLIKKNKKKDL